MLRLSTFLIFVLGLTVLLSAAAMDMVSATAAGASVSESPTFGPPTSVVTLKGTGFAAGETVDIEFDGSILMKVTANTTGMATAKPKVPATAKPGNHTWTLVGETSGLSASIVFLVRTDWAQLGFSSIRTGTNPYENVLSPGTIGTLHNLWSVSASSSNRIHSSPAVYRDVVYVGDDDGKVRAFNDKTGALVWTSAALGGSIYATPAVSGTTVYVTTTDTNGTGHGTLYALKTADGTQLWFHTAASPYESSAAVLGSTVVARSGTDLTAFSSTGGVLWSNGDGDTGFGASPVLSKALVYVASSGQVHAYHLAGGTSAWSVTGASCGGLSTPVSGSILLSTGICGSVAFALNANTGALIWTGDVRTNTGTLEDLTGVPAIAGTTAFFPLGDEIVARSLSTGALVWHLNTGTFNTAPEGDAAVADGLLYVTSGSGIAWYRTSNGTALGGLSGNLSTGAIADGRLYFEVTDLSTFVAVDAYTCIC
jgi:outer membrane protein assembly factor BamB